MPLSDYTPLLEWLRGRETYGDVVEIGVLIGDGTKQLLQAFPNRVVWAVDTFDIYADTTKNEYGVGMYQFYKDELGGRNQYEAFESNVGIPANLRVFIGFSEDFIAPENIFLSIIDGGHDPDIAKQDYRNLSHSKFVAFHDYRHDLPELTKAIDEVTEGKERHVLPGWLIVAH